MKKKKKKGGMISANRDADALLSSPNDLLIY